VNRSTLLAGILILAIAGGLAGADFIVRERPRIIAEQTPIDLPELPSSSSSSMMSSSVSSSADAASSSSSSAVSQTSSSGPAVVKKGVSTKKAGGINIDTILAALQLIQKETGEASFLQFTVTDKSLVKTVVLLRNNDRAFLFSWIDSNDVKPIFAGLKEALQAEFSGKVSDLVDETRTSPNGPPVDYLSFLDPALSAERIVFIRVRTRLYEIHVAKNGEGLIDQLLAELSK
jgi:hypothetical protein